MPPDIPDDVAARLAYESDPRRIRERRLMIAEMEANADRRARQLRLRRAQNAADQPTAAAKAAKASRLARLRRAMRD